MNNTGTILDQIVARKQEELQLAKTRCSLQDLQQFPAFRQPVFSLKERLMSGKTTGIIAEFKRKSPSKGWLNREADSAEVAASYQQYGAAGMSVLTDVDFFGGTPSDLQQIQVSGLPLLRKDFMIDEYQFYEARAWGASVVLLIAACLSPEQSRAFTCVAHSLDLEVLLEVHTLKELETHYHSDTDMIGVNCRNLKTFELDHQLFATMAAALPKGVVKVAESGIDNAETITPLRTLGYTGFLMGEQFMKQPDPGLAFARFASKL